MDVLPLISVIVPVYKVEAYLDHCIRSIAEQTYSNLEILLVDDGSPDGSGAICDAWAAKDGRIRVFHKANAGAGAARNTALDEAAGELIAFVDSDDYLAPDMYEHLYGLLNTGADIAECGYVETNGDDVVFGDGDGSIRSYTPVEAMSAHIRETAFRQVIWNKLYRRQMVGNIRFPVGQKIDDEYFTYQVLGRASLLTHSGRVCYAYRQQPDSVMHQGFSLRQVQSLTAKRNRLRYLREKMPELENEAKAELVMSCIYAMQGCRRWLSGEEREQAQRLIYETIEDAVPLDGTPDMSGKKKALIKLAQRNLDGAAALLNFLEKIHVLS